MMRHISQKRSTDCGVAAFAMIMNLSYRKAMKILHPKRFWWFSDATTTLGMIQEGCKQLGYDTELADEELDFRKITTRAILAIKISETKNHAVAWDPLRQRIMDPSGKGLSVEYCIKNLVGSCFIIP